MKKTEAGRSMIEMLGVLAIIGVLSIGGFTILDYASRCVVVAQTTGDGSTMETGDCQAILDGETLPGGATGISITSAATEVDQPVVTVEHDSEKVLEAMDNRSGGTVSISDGVITFNTYAS